MLRLFMKIWSICETIMLSAIALYDFTGTGDPNELHFRKDEVLELQTTDGDWLQARSNGKTGMVPRNYIQILTDVKPISQSNEFTSQSSGIVPNAVNQQDFDKNLLQQFNAALANLNENQPIPQNVMSSYSLAKEHSIKLNERVSKLQQEQNKLLELHSKVVHANQLYDQLMEYQMISKMNFQ
eukprot:NODE_14_length_51535_cov_1.125049.p34 type:complete len:183 gc:universal NODE_14_length_51535_cov_1.125049:36270-36818(+)